MIVPQHATAPFTTLDLTITLANFVARLDDLVSQLSSPKCHGWGCKDSTCPTGNSARSCYCHKFNVDRSCTFIRPRYVSNTIDKNAPENRLFGAGLLQQIWAVDNGGIGANGRHPGKLSLLGWWCADGDRCGPERLVKKRGHPKMAPKCELSLRGRTTLPVYFRVPFPAPRFDLCIEAVVRRVLATDLPRLHALEATK